MDTDKRILERFINNHTSEALLMIENLDEEEIAVLLKSLSPELSSILLCQMDRFKAARCLEKIDPEIAIKLIETLTTSIAALILRQMDKNLRNSILDRLSSENSKSIHQILRYPDNTVGAYLDPLVFTLLQDLSISQGLERIKENQLHILSHIFVLSRDHLLVGFIELKELIKTDESKPIREVMNPNPPKILADMNINTLLEGWGGWDKSFPFLPVVDLHGIFLGVITWETLTNINKMEKTMDRHAQQASMALGDLYQIGFSSLIRSASEIIWEYKSK